MKKLNQITILNYLKSKKDSFFKEYSINKIGIFGSFARNNQKEFSDIDIVYETTTKDLSYSQLLKFEEELKSVFNKDIDLVNINYMNPFVKKSALKEIIYV